jgi:thioredoxin 1
VTISQNGSPKSVKIKPSKRTQEEQKMSVFHITQDNFQQEVLNSDKPVLLDFWASWCGPCRMVGPIIDEIAGEHPEIKVGKINVDEQQELAAAFKIMSIPTLMVVKDGKVVNQAMGVRPKDQILSML